jgi:hypothetical protein
MNKHLKQLPPMIFLGTLPVRIMLITKDESEALGGSSGQFKSVDGEPVIRILDSLGTAIAVEVVLHEILHAIWWRAGLPCDTTGEGVQEEKAVEALATGLADVLIMNPALVLWIRECGLKNAKKMRSVLNNSSIIDAGPEPEGRVF